MSKYLIFVSEIVRGKEKTESAKEQIENTNRSIASWQDLEMIARTEK